MEVDAKLIRHVAQVARIELTNEEVEKFVPELKEILENFEVLGEVDTEGVEPSFQPLKMRDALREDEIEPSLSQEDALKNSLETKDGYFRGPGAL